MSEQPSAKVVRIKRTRSKREGPKWLQECITGETGRPLSVLANVLIGLRAVLPIAFAYDEMLCVPMLMHPLEIQPSFTPRPCTDVDIGVVQEKCSILD